MRRRAKGTSRCRIQEMQQVAAGLAVYSHQRADAAGVAPTANKQMQQQRLLHVRCRCPCRCRCRRRRQNRKLKIPREMIHPLNQGEMFTTLNSVPKRNGKTVQRVRKFSREFQRQHPSHIRTYTRDAANGEGAAMACRTKGRPFAVQTNARPFAAKLLQQLSDAYPSPPYPPRCVPSPSKHWSLST